MANTKISDLNVHLFGQLEKLSDVKLAPEKIELECKKAKAMIGISGEIIKSFKLTVDAAKLISEGDITKNNVPEFLVNELVDVKKLNP